MSEDKSMQGLQAAADKAEVSHLPAEKVMSSKKPLTIMEGAKIFSVIQSLCTHSLSGAPVVDPSGRIMGVISEHDLLLQAATQDLSSKIAYNKSIFSVDPKMELKDIIIEFYKKKVRWLPVVGSDRKVLGVIHRIDVLNCLIAKGKA